MHKYVSPKCSSCQISNRFPKHCFTQDPGEPVSYFEISPFDSYNQFIDEAGFTKV